MGAINLADLLALISLPLWAVALAIVSPKERRVFQIVMIAFAVKVLLGLINTFIFQFFPPNNDWGTLYRMGLVFAQDPEGIAGTLTQAKGRYFFSWLLSLQYRAIGEGVFPVIVSGVWLSSLVSIFTYHLTMAVYHEKKLARWLLIFTTVFPFYFSSAFDPSREPLITAAFMLFAVTFIQWTTQRKGWLLGVSLFSLVIASSIHSGFAVLLIAVLGYLIVNANKNFFFRRGRGAGTWIVTSVLGVGVMTFVVATGWGLNKFGGDVSNLGAIETLERGSYGGDNENRTGYIASSELEITSFSELITQTPGRVVLFLFKPYPWDVSSPIDLVAILSSIVFLVALIAILKHWRFFWSNIQLRMMIYMCAVLIPLFALGTLSWGTAVRHKSKFMPIAAILAAGHFAQRRPKLRVNSNMSTIPKQGGGS